VQWRSISTKGPSGRSHGAAIRREGAFTTYELRLPFTELGGLRPAVGGKMGLSIQVNDNDGKGLAARMNWGGGISPSWRPGGFGVVTFTE